MTADTGTNLIQNSACGSYKGQFVLPAISVTAQSSMRDVEARAHVLICVHLRKLVPARRGSAAKEDHAIPIQLLRRKAYKKTVPA
jgi:hypothetical protein